MVRTGVKNENLKRHILDPNAMHVQNCHLSRFIWNDDRQKFMLKFNPTFVTSIRL